jgi:hypothetical protein
MTLALIRWGFYLEWKTHCKLALIKSLVAIKLSDKPQDRRKLILDVTLGELLQ